MCWDRCLELITARQAVWEARAAAIVDGGGGGEAMAALLSEHARAAVADWWSLDDELTLRFGDGAWPRHQAAAAPPRSLTALSPVRAPPAL